VKTITDKNRQAQVTNFIKVLTSITLNDLEPPK